MITHSPERYVQAWGTISAHWTTFAPDMTAKGPPFLFHSLDHYEHSLVHALNMMDGNRYAARHPEIGIKRENRIVSRYANPATREVAQFTALIHRFKNADENDQSILNALGQFIQARGLLTRLAAARSLGSARIGLELYFYQDWREILGLPILSDASEGEVTEDHDQMRHDLIIATLTELLNEVWDWQDMTVAEFNGYLLNKKLSVRESEIQS